MSTAVEILAAHRIPRHARLSVYTTTCPECSDKRSKKKQKCLSVLIDRKGVRFNCHHCGWHGHEFYDEPSKSNAEIKPITVEQNADHTRERNRRSAHGIWRESVPLPGTLGERYFIEHRKIDIAGIDLTHVLRWHKSDRMVVALMTDVVTGEPVGVHRTFLDRDGGKRTRKMLGPAGVIRLWPDDAVEQGLAIGEGIETTLAAALGVAHRGTLLRPAWALGSANTVASFPVLPGITSLTILTDNDPVGQNAAKECAARWAKAGREVICLTPHAVKDFNDVIREAAS
jgi:predicted RNA-binding Zn-ribbon protein involved in translation (DUF1610 family)